MNDLRRYRDAFVENEDIEYLYANHSLKFVEYIEKIGLADRIAEISETELRNSVKYYHDSGSIQTVTTMNNHLNAIKRFYSFLFSEGKVDKNIFFSIKDYDRFKQDIVDENNLKAANGRGYLELDLIEELLNYFNSRPQKYANMTMLGFFFKITLLIPAKRKVIANLKVGDFSDNYDRVTVNGFDIKLPRALRQDIRIELSNNNKKVEKDMLFFELFCGCKYSENVFNTPFYYALKEIGYNVEKGKDTYPVEDIRNTSIVNLAENGVNPYLIAKLSGLSLSGLDNLLRKFEVNVCGNDDDNKKINQEICKMSFYHNI